MESITLEVRPRLCAVNAYICLQKCPNVSSVSVKLVENSVILELEDRIIRLFLHPVKIIPMTLSSLRILNNWISFRIQTNPPNSSFGTFKAEILGTKIDQNNSDLSNLSSVALPDKNMKHVLKCANCQAYISKVIKFSRVLPLPHQNYDQSEWFCCSHGNKTNYQVYSALRPRDTDYFYRSYYSVLNKSVFISDLKITDSNVHCHRCLSILGLRQDNESIKIWNCSIDRESSNVDNSNTFQISASKTFDDFLLVIKESMGIFIGEQMLFETWDKNCVCYILLKPMEFRVDLLTESNSRDCENDVHLQQIQAMKVMYTYGENERSLASDYPNVKHCHISPKVLGAGLDYLSSSTKRFPPEYRVVDDHFIGYLTLPNSLK